MLSLVTEESSNKDDLEGGNQASPDLLRHRKKVRCFKKENLPFFLPRKLQ
jgi:hypothetical protein